MHYHLIIIGAGPAGCSAAIMAAEAGLSVMIIESRPFPRKRPGETLHPGIEPLFLKLGVLKEISESDYERPSGFFCQDEEITTFMPYRDDIKENNWRGWLIPRDEMDNYLLKRAELLGVKVLVHKGYLKTEPGKTMKLQVSHENYSCDYLMDASGYNFWLSRQLDLEIIRTSDTLISYYGICKGKFETGTKTPCFFRDKNSWTWIAKLDESTYQWTHLNYTNKWKNKNWRPQILDSLVPAGVTKSRDVTWRISSAPAGKNYFCIGDAAFVTDPSSSQGVLKAIMSGMMTVHLIQQVLIKKNIEPEDASGFYNEWIRKWFNHEISNMKKTKLYV